MQNHIMFHAELYCLVSVFSCFKFAFTCKFDCVQGILISCKIFFPANSWYCGFSFCWQTHQINLARETLKGLLAHWLSKRRNRFGTKALANGDVPTGKEITSRSITLSKVEVDGNSENDSLVYPPFEFLASSSPSIITEGSQGGPWRKKITDLDGTEDEKDFPWWVLDCVLNNRLPPRENTK